MKALLLSVAAVVLFAGAFVPEASARHHHHDRYSHRDYYRRDYRRVVVYERPTYYSGYDAPYYDDDYCERPYYRTYHHRYYSSRPRVSFAFGF